jgi:hypothetical protein
MNIECTGRYECREGNIAYVTGFRTDPVADNECKSFGAVERPTGMIPGRFAKTWWLSDGRHALYEEFDLINFIDGECP